MSNADPFLTISTAATTLSTDNEMVGPAVGFLGTGVFSSYELYVHFSEHQV